MISCVCRALAALPASNLLCVFTLKSSIIASLNDATLTALKAALSTVAGGSDVLVHARPNSTEVATFVSGGSVANTTELCNALVAELPKHLPTSVFGQVRLHRSVCC